MEIRQLYYVLEIAKHNSFSKAAEELYITQPTISHQINVLEEELQTKLFERNTHRVQLTPDGRVFCDRARKITGEIERLYQDLGKEQNVEKMCIRIGLFPFYKTVGLGRIIKSYFREHSNVVGSMETMENYKAFRMLRQNQLDFAILKNTEEIDEKGIVCERIAKEKIGVLINRRNACAALPYLTMNDIGRLSLLTGERGTHIYNGMEEACKKYGVDFNVSFYNTNETEMLIEMIRADIGVMMASDSVCKYFEDDDLVRKELRPLQEMETFIAYRKDKKMHQVHSKFKEYILQQYERKND